MKKVVSISVLILFFIIICLTNRLNAISTNTFKRGVIVGGKVNVREQPNNRAKIITVVNFSEVVEIIEWTNRNERIGNFEGKWVKVKTESGKTGYLFGPFLFDIGYQREIYKKNSAIILGKVVQIKEKPDWQAKNVSSVKIGEQVIIIQKTNIDGLYRQGENRPQCYGKWFKIKTMSGKTGYVSSAVLFEIAELYSKKGFRRIVLAETWGTYCYFYQPNYFIYREYAGSDFVPRDIINWGNFQITGRIMHLILKGKNYSGRESPVSSYILYTGSGFIDYYPRDVFWNESCCLHGGNPFIPNN